MRSVFQFPALRFFLSIILVLGLAAPVVAMGASSKASGLTFLKAKGHDLVDENGKKILLRGVGLGNWLLPEGYMWKFGGNGDRPRKIEKLIEQMIGKKKAREFWTRFRDDYITEQDIIIIKRLGYNSIRPAFMSRLFVTEGDNPQWIDEGWKYMDRVVGWGKKHGLYVIIDMHGAPGGQTGKNIDDSPNDHPDLFKYPKNQVLLEKWWVMVAERYKDEPAVAGYDLLNEPLPGDFDKLGYRDELFGLYKRITRAIRKIDKRHAIILEGAHWSNDWTTLGPPFDDNLVYQFHKYWNDIDTKSIQGYIDYRKKWNVPVWIGETGENNIDWYWAAMQLLEDHNMGWSFWPWKKLDTENTPYSVKKPKGWEKIVAFSHGKEKPSAAEAEKILWRFLENIKIANCEYHENVNNAILRRAPAKVQGEHFGHQGKGKSYSYSEGMPKASSYRTAEHVPIKSLSESYNIGWVEQGEWLAFDVTVEKDGLYDIAFNTGGPEKGTSYSLIFGEENVTGEVLSPATGGWEDYAEVVKKGVQLKAGKHKVKWISITGGHNWDWFEVRQAGQKSAPDRPKNAKMKRGSRGILPGRVEAENYGIMGEGVSYHDTDKKNNGDKYRKDGVDIQELGKTFAAVIKDGQWTRYEINQYTRKARKYCLTAYAAASKAGSLGIYIDGKAAGKINIAAGPAKTHQGSPITLTPGKHYLDIRGIGSDIELDWFELK